MGQGRVYTKNEWRTLGEAALHAGVAESTMRKWADDEMVKCFKTPGGHRRFLLEDIDEFLDGKSSDEVPHSRTGPGPALAMIVDDDESVLRMVEEVFKRNDFAAVSAKNAREALLLMNKRLPDLLVIDVKMPGMDGWQMLKKIREKLDVSHLPVIVFSGEVSEDELRQAGPRGAQGYMKKPFDPASLVVQAKALLEKEEVAS